MSPYPDELRTAESVRKDRALPGPDGDGRPLNEELDPALEAELEEARSLRLEKRWRDQDRAGV
jgi:hypothetical protein